MTYRLEVAWKKNQNWGACQLQNKIIKLAQYFGCEEYYSGFEIMGEKRTIKRNAIFIILNFPEDPNYIVNFLKSVKNDRNIYIESIGFDNIKFTLLYASKLYLNMMDKNKVTEYLNNKNSIDENLNYKRIVQAVK